MLVTKIVLLLSLVLGSFFLAEVQGFKQPKCRGKNTKLTPEELKIMSECLKEFSPTSKTLGEMSKDSMGCVGKCILQKQGLIDPKGVPVKDNVFKMVNATFEPDVAKEADELLGKCVDEKTSGIDTSEKMQDISTICGVRGRIIREGMRR